MDPNVTKFIPLSRNERNFKDFFVKFAVLYMDNITSVVAVSISVLVGLVVAIVVQLLFVPWQRREITGQAQKSDRVKFTINDSSESTPSGSPKRKQQTHETNSLPAIAEQTELASFNKRNGLSARFFGGDSATRNGNCKIDSKYIEKAENLLGNDRSLDNTDLTITSLNYIDEHHHHQNGYLRATTQREPLQTYFDNQLNGHQLMSNPKQR